MKKFALAVCLILALPLIFSGQRQRGNPTNVVAQNCIETGNIGNCIYYEPSQHQHLGASGSKESGNPESPIVIGIGTLSMMLLILWAMRL